MTKLKQIKGALPKKKQFNAHQTCGCQRCTARDAFNEAIDLIGEKDFTMNREKLAEVICDSRYGNESWLRYNKSNSDVYKQCIVYSLDDADAIIANLDNLLEVKE